MSSRWCRETRPRHQRPHLRLHLARSAASSSSTAESHGLVTSEAIVAEIREKLLKKFRMPPPAVDDAVAALFAGMEVVHPTPLPSPVSRDPDDDVVIATAVAGGCDAVITGDADLLVLAVHGPIRFLTPRDFWDLDRPPEAGIP